ncbi:imelysin family protein [Enterovibrio sp. ZSDZ42]|uniref:Imelysin family protein n=1 Tax=Enterovibrio gelatinilyticus TaxID=2899819 RepID=A0ABT5R3B0_9GAMM|nr:imelysin family protein [Enterovibrio sp. ZSDZ42]MDD1794747.1 imelysin family protein [Enterovibrio sp. ZSDZ42]
MIDLANRAHWLCGFSLLVTLSLISGCDSQATNISVSNMQLGEQLWGIQKQSTSSFIREAKVLESEIAALCEVKTHEALAGSQTQWVKTIKAWQSVAGANYGNEAAMSLSWQIQFYPDKKNTIGRQIGKLLKSDKDMSALSLENQSVAVQGLGALEWLLFDGMQKGESKIDILVSRCPLTQAISSHLVFSSELMASAWQDNLWKGAAKEQRERDALNILASQLDSAIKTLSLPMGKPGYPKPYQAQAWRSGQSLALLRERIEALQARYIGSVDGVLREQGREALADRLVKHWSFALESVPNGDAIKPYLSEPAEYRKLITLSNNLEYIKIALADEVAAALGMVVGFNSTDGD